jgi:hypothetical protein
MFDIALVIFMQASAPAAAPAAQQAAVAETAAVKDEEKIVCTMEPITGTRARKQKVCKTPGYEKGAERSRDMLSAIQRASNVQPPEPPASGGRPGGPGY